MRHAWWVLGVVLVIGGIVVALTAPAPPADVGWFAYTPLDDSSWSSLWDASGTSAARFVSRQQIVGWVVAVVGLLTLAAGLGYRLGRRAERSARP